MSTLSVLKLDKVLPYRALISIQMQVALLRPYCLELFNKVREAGSHCSHKCLVPFQKFPEEGQVSGLSSNGIR